MLAAFLGVALSSQTLSGTPNRFDLAYPFPNLPPVRIDKVGSGVGVAHQWARANNRQARMLWVDTTANIERYNTEEKIVALVEKASDIGFNTIVFDIKPIIGYTIYPSALTEQLTSWRGRTLPAGFDPVPIFVRESRKRGLKLYVSLNAFSEGHRFAREQNQNREFANGKPGPGYDLPDQQSVQLFATPVLKVGEDIEITLSPTLNQPDAESIATLFDRAPQTGVGFVLRNGVVVRPLDHTLQPGERALVFRNGDRFRLRNMTGMRYQLEAKHEFFRSGERQNQIPLMMNPFHPAVIERTQAFAREVVRKYAIDGILYDDRLRFTGIDGDFSPITREIFEKRLGKKLNWPTDVFEFTFNEDLRRGIKPGRYWDHWWAFRSGQMKAWVEIISALVRKERSGTIFGIYAGSWFGEYDTYGANYSSPTANVGLPWLTHAMRGQGFASSLDVFVSGCYYRVPTIYDAMVAGLPEGRTVEAGAQLSNRVVDDRAFAVAGIALDQFYADPSQVQGALQAAAAASQGVMVFDLSHRFEQFEPHLRRAFARRVLSPIGTKEIAEVRRRRAAMDQAGYVPPPIFLYPGAPGVGH